jgi:uncharacterized protein (DUF2164 family)
VLQIKLSREHKEEIIKELQQYYEDERQETLGNLEAEDLINFMVNTLGPFLYNQAVDDARTVLMDRYNSLEEELYALRRLRNRK